MKINDIIEFEVDCDIHTPESVFRVVRFVEDGSDRRYTEYPLRGRHWFRVKICGHDGDPDGIGALPAQVAEAFREKFCRLGVDGKYHPNVSFGGSWGEHQIFLCGCQLGPYCIGRAGVTPVILEHKKL